jgi:hypothetical protein
MSDPAPKRRWFQWSLRTLFVVVTVAAVVLWTLRRHGPNGLAIFKRSKNGRCRCSRRHSRPGMWRAYPVTPSPNCNEPGLSVRLQKGWGLRQHRAQSGNKSLGEYAFGNGVAEQFKHLIFRCIQGAWCHVPVLPPRKTIALFAGR